MLSSGDASLIVVVILIYSTRSITGFSQPSRGGGVGVGVGVGVEQVKVGRYRTQLSIQPNDQTSRTKKSGDSQGPSALEKRKELLFELLDSSPANVPTPTKLTKQILDVVRELEESCPTEDNCVLGQLAGNWELMWTAQDKSSPEWQQNPLRTWINIENRQIISICVLCRFFFISCGGVSPLENQSYSNNPNGDRSADAAGGRSNPILPREIQDRLEDMGILQASGGSASSSSNPVRSSQAIDLAKCRVRNVVSFEAPTPRFLPFVQPNKSSVRGSLIVDVKFRPNESDLRRVDVKFDSCRLVVPKSPVDVTFPLGPMGPTGWLRTGFIDDTMRITRGHKGSVFILQRPLQGKSNV
eukprot:scaffold15494_cov57-Attheya_sp.AAC.3